jgi:Mg2+ and Co2+ transporter CorA
MRSEKARSDGIHCSSYRDLVIKYRARNPALSWLVDFFQRPEVRTAQLAVLEFFPDKVQHREFTDVFALEKYWQDIHHVNASNNTNMIIEECKGRLYILEDLSSAYISALGTRFNLDPMLFVRYGFTPAYIQSNPKELERQPPWVLQPLFSTQMESEALTLMYYEVRELGEIKRDELMDEKIRWETFTNVVRRIVQINRRRESKPGLVRRNVTFWSKQNGRNEPWDGRLQTRSAPYLPICFFSIRVFFFTVFFQGVGSDYESALLIVDPSIKRKLRFRQKEPPGSESEFFPAHTIDCQSSLYMNGYLDFLPWSTSRNGEEKLMPIPLVDSSPFEDIIYYWKHASRADIEAAIKNPAHTALFAAKIAASSWLVLLTFISNSVSTLETAVHRFEDLEHNTGTSTVIQEIARLRMQMANVNRLRRYFWWYIYHMKSNLEAIGQPTTTSSDSQTATIRNLPGPSSALRAFVLDDFSLIYERLLLIQKNIDSLMPIVIGANSLLEAQLNSLDTKYVLRLTILALVFVPISSTTGLFSMADKYLPGQPDSWVVALVCVLLLFVVFFLAFGRVVVERLVAIGWGLGKKEGSFV